MDAQEGMLMTQPDFKIGKRDQEFELIKYKCQMCGSAEVGIVTHYLECVLIGEEHGKQMMDLCLDMKCDPHTFKVMAPEHN